MENNQSNQKSLEKITKTEADERFIKRLKTEIFFTSPVSFIGTTSFAAGIGYGITNSDYFYVASCAVLGGILVLDMYNEYKRKMDTIRQYLNNPSEHMKKVHGVEIRN